MDYFLNEPIYQHILKMIEEKANVIILHASGNIAHFEDGANADAVSVIAHIEPVQEGSGDPSPDNVRPITGHTGMNVVVSPTTDAEDGTTYPTTFPAEAGTVFGGYVDVTNGELTAEMDVTDLSALTWVWDSTYEFWRTDMLSSVIKKSATISMVTDSICEEYKAFGYNTLQLDNSLIGFAVATTGRVAVRNGSNTVKPAHDICYYLATPIEYNITPQQITTLLGVNNVWNDCNGSTDITYKADTKLYIDILVRG